MCLFPRPARPKDWTNVPKYDRFSISEYKCGCCPECLSEKSKFWALRAYMEASVSPSMMITLTYDSYIYDDKGRIVGEEVDTGNVCKKDCQDFIKRLRARVAPLKIKYLLTAEYGKRTGRRHYHAIIFGYQFPDCVPYKKSKRGNRIYRSSLLSEIWGKGICTVDSLNASPQIARYCTKYCAKDSGRNDLFMLYSRGIGDLEMLRRFNGKSYMISGREYPIPRTVWQKFILSKYQRYTKCGKDKYYLTTRYINRYTKFLRDCEEREFPVFGLSMDNLAGFMFSDTFNLTRVATSLEKQAKRNALARSLYRSYRNRDSVYRLYRKYWDRKSKQISRNRPPVLNRILALPNSRYFSYKNACLKTLNRRKLFYEFDSLLQMYDEPLIPRSKKWNLAHLP